MGLMIHSIALENKINIIPQDSEWKLLTKAVSLESKGEPFIGQLFVAQTIINRKNGCNCPVREVLTKKFHSNPNYIKWIEAEPLDTALMRKLRILENVKIHSFWYFYNLKTATDTKFLRAMKKKKHKLQIYNHIFVEK